MWRRQPNVGPLGSRGRRRQAARGPRAEVGIANHARRHRARPARRAPKSALRFRVPVRVRVEWRVRHRRPKVCVRCACAPRQSAQPVSSCRGRHRQQPAPASRNLPEPPRRSGSILQVALCARGGASGLHYPSLQPTDAMLFVDTQNLGCRHSKNGVCERQIWGVSLI